MSAETDPRAALVDRIRTVLAAAATVREVNMFGAIAFMVDERMAVAAARGGDLLVRVKPVDYARHLEHGGEPADMGTGRPMGESWLMVRAPRIEDDADLASWVRIGLDARPSARRG